MTVVEPTRGQTAAAETAPTGPSPRGALETVPTGGLSQQVSYPESGTAVLTVAGEVDAATALRLEEMLQSRLCSQLARLVLDLSQVGFLAVAGLSVITAADLRARSSGADLVLVTGDNRPVTRALQATAGQHALRWQTGPVANAPAGGRDDPARR